MAVQERSRRSLYDLLKEPLGMDATNALLDELPPIGADLATKADIDVLRHATTTDIDALRKELRGVEQRLEEKLARQIAEVGTQVAEAKSHLSAQTTRLMLGIWPLMIALIVFLFTHT
jgi:uncharacterized membrane protein (DUF106 family)